MATKEFCDSCDKEVNWLSKWQLEYKVRWYHFGWHDMVLCYKCFTGLGSIKQ